MADKKKADKANHITDVFGTDGGGKKAHGPALADKSLHVEESKGRVLSGSIGAKPGASRSINASKSKDGKEKPTSNTNILN